MLGLAITIVGDDDDLLEYLRGVLGVAGYTVHTFNQAGSAYDTLRTNPPDAVIIGVAFPDCQPGIDLATVLKLRPETRALPIILTSADRAWLRLYTDRLYDNAIPALWALSQPIDVSVLLPLLAHAIGRLERAVP